MKRIVVLGLVVGLVGVASANDWLGGVGDWNVGSNWSEGLPTSSSAVVIDTDGSIVSLSGTGGEATSINMSVTGAMTTVLNISTGLTCQGWTQLGVHKNGIAAVDVSGSADIASKGIHVGHTGSGTLNIYAGTVRAGLTAVNKFGFYVGNRNSGNSNGTVNLSGGTLDLSFLEPERVQLATLNASAKAALDISGGALIVQGDITNLWDAITTGLGQVTLTGYGQANNFAYNYDVGSDTTTVTGIPEPTTIALLGVGGLALLFTKRR